MPENYSTVTELPGNKASKEQLARLYQRYRFASQFCENKEVLEVACGGGMGLGYLARGAKRVIGGDIDRNILKYAIEHYKNHPKIEIRVLDAQKLPFEDKSIDVVILYEAIYYLSQPEKFVNEAYRILRENGVLLICTVNKDWPDFNQSPYSVKYFSAPDLKSLLNKKFSKTELFGAFPISRVRLKDKIISSIKRIAITFHIIPKTMKGKENLKRILFGKLMILPNEINEGITEYFSPKSISSNYPDFQHKILFAVAYV